MSPSARLGTAVLLLLASGLPARAQTVDATLTADLGAIARLSLSPAAISFADADPDTSPQVTAAPLSITAKARARQGSTVTLTVLASDELRSGVAVIAASNLTWTAAGLGFVAGTLSTSTPQVVASWTGSGVRSGIQTYALANRWTYVAGTYSLSLVYTLAAP